MRGFGSKVLISVFVILLILFVFGTGFILGDIVGDGVNNNMSTGGGTMDAVVTILKERFYFGENSDEYQKQLYNDAINGMVSAQGDLFTEYMSAEELSMFTGSLESSFVGIGVTYNEVDHNIFVISVVRGSPAEAAGVLAGDFIIEIEGNVVAENDIDDMAALIAGKKGTDVHIKLLRGNEVIDMAITRDEISNTVFSEIIDGVGVLTLSSFSDGTGKELKNHLEYFKENNVKSLIIDLRDNGGGYVTTLDTICSYFMDKNDIIMREVDRDGNETIDYVTDGEKFKFDKYIILTDKDTASCSEVFTMAMIENCGAVTVGDTTYGKGVAQVTIRFRDGSALKYTDLTWRSGNGVYIGGVGIAPDYPVSLHPILYEGYLILEDDETYKYDSVSEKVATMQKMLDFLGYDVSRMDGYFDRQTEEALKAFQKDAGIAATGIIDEETANLGNGAVVRTWNLQRDKYDVQIQKAFQLAKGE